MANLVTHTDFNCLSVIEYATRILKVEHIILCGHYGCGGVHEALENKAQGFINNWLRHLRDIYYTHSNFLDSIDDPLEKADRLCELNVVSQVKNICRTSMLQDAWQRNQEISVHGWIYNISNGLLNDLNISVSGSEQLEEITRSGFAAICKKTNRL